MNVTEPLTVAPAMADAGIVTDVVTSARGEIAVVAVAESGCRFAPWLVVVVMVQFAVTEPLAGAVKSTPMLNDDADDSVVGRPVKVTEPVPAL